MLYRQLKQDQDHNDVVDYLYSLKKGGKGANEDFINQLKEKFFCKSPKSVLKVTEIGDGNLNFVYFVTNETTNDSLIVKQAVPFIRIAPDWPLTETRAHFEAAALIEHGRHTKMVPKLFHFDAQLCLLVMEYLAPPYAIVRQQLIDRVTLPSLGSNVALFCAQTLFSTSSIAMASDEKRQLVAKFSLNHAMCKTTEQVIFTEPFARDCAHNRHSKKLDSLVDEIRRNKDVLIRANELKNEFQVCRLVGLWLNRRQCNTQALLHGDLHTGSIMAQNHDIKVIDAEFAFVGPIAFDTGLFVANLLMSVLSQRAREGTKSDIQQFEAYLLGELNEFWTTFEQSFRVFWNSESTSGDCYSRAFLGDQLTGVQNDFLAGVFRDTLGFAALEVRAGWLLFNDSTRVQMIRRTVGIAHVDDVDKIADEESKVGVEKNVLKLALEMLTSKKMKSIGDLVDKTKKLLK